ELTQRSHCAWIRCSCWRTGRVISKPAPRGAAAASAAAAGGWSGAGAGAPRAESDTASARIAANERSAGAAPLAALLDITDPQAVEEVLQEGRFLRRQVARGLLAQDVQQVDVEAGHLEVLGRLAIRQLHVAQVERDRLGQERGKIVEAG